MSTTGSVHWEWFYGWKPAFDDYFPKYATSGEEEGCVKSFFATNVPYNFYPTPVEWPVRPDWSESDPSEASYTRSRLVRI